MVLFYLTTASLEILSGVAWWVIMKTTNGLYYVVYGNKKGNELGKIELSSKENNDQIEKLIKIQESNQLQINKLTESIEILNGYILESNQRKQRL